jgi:hypothetical protein
MKRRGQVFAGTLSVGMILLIASSALSEPKQPATGGDDSRPQRTSRKELEQRFQETLTGAVLQGTWQVTGEEGLAGKAPLSEPKPDKYTIVGVTKISDEYWTINARIEYADKDVTIPVTVRVVWADGVPIITLDPVDLPMLGRYSARVMIDGHFYCGTWFGSSYGGVMSGQIVRPADPESVAPKSAAKEPADG